MKLRRLTATGAIAALGVAAAAAPALAATNVSVRVEGTSKTLLATKTVTVPTSGSITKGGAPAGSCPATKAGGALNVATKGNWNGSYSSSVGGIEVNTILGQTESYDNGKGGYWELFVNNRAASAGICDLNVSNGSQLLFAAVPASGTEYPIVLSAPKTATVGKAFTVKAFYYTGTGSATKPVAGASFTGIKGTTNKSGVATVTATKPGMLMITGSAKGEIRSAAQMVTVAK